MFRIGEFSILSKTTIKTIRYYERVGLIKPSFVDKETKYRYYDASKLDDISKIISLRELGLSIKDIKLVNKGEDFNLVLSKRKKEIEDAIINYNHQLQKINVIMESNKMNQEVIIKNVDECTVYYCEGVINDYSEINDFVLSVGKEVAASNPKLLCDDYCFISYLDGKPTDKNIKIRYTEKVKEKGKETERIKFKVLPAVKVVSIMHKGSYSVFPNIYSFLFKYMEEHNLKMKELPRECYIDGCWNKEKEEDYLSEIQIPIE